MTALASAALERYGNDMDPMAMGRAPISPIFPMPCSSACPLLRDWLRVAIPTAGGYDTVNRGPTTIRDEAHPFEQRFGAGLRIITDLAAPADSRMMIAVPGQSGNPLSPHYADLLRRWRDFDWLVPDRGPAAATLDPGAGAMTDLPVSLARYPPRRGGDRRRRARRPRLVRRRALSEMSGCEVFLKLENLHPTGSFKERGALNKLLRLSAERAARRRRRDVGRQPRAGRRLPRAAASAFRRRS